MVQHNSNKLNTALYISFWNIIKLSRWRTLESIYHTFIFIFSVRPEVNDDVLACGLDCICMSISATQKWWSDRQWCLSPSLRRRTLYPQQSLTIVVPGWIHTLMMASNVSAEWSGKGSRQVFPIPARYQQRPMLSHANRCNYTFAWWSSWSISTILPPPPANQHKKSCKEQLKMKSEHCLVAELWSVSDSLVVNAEFCMTLDGRRMASYFEQGSG